MRADRIQKSLMPRVFPGMRLVWDAVVLLCQALNDFVIFRLIVSVTRQKICLFPFAKQIPTITAFV